MNLAAGRVVHLAGSLALAGVVWAGTSAHAAPPSKFHLAGDTAGVVITSETDYADGTALAAERADRRPGHGLAADDRLLPPLELFPNRMGGWPPRTCSRLAGVTATPRRPAPELR